MNLRNRVTLIAATALALACTVFARPTEKSGAAARPAQGMSSPSATSPGGKVLYFPKQQADASFDKNAVIYDGGGRNYNVHTSKRTETGMVEVHGLDTDVFYVVKGSASFVTGGTVTDEKDGGKDEKRGTTITGGETHELGEGDVVVVPNGTPHWFKEIHGGPFLYFLVKVR